MSRLFDLTGKVAIVTGSSRGIGLAIAAALAEQGAKVVISSRKQDACDEVAARDQRRAWRRHRDRRRREHLVQGRAAEPRRPDAQAQFGRIDVLVCNAASNPYYGPMAGISDDQFRKILDNNVIANHWLISMVAPDMLERGEGLDHHHLVGRRADQLDHDRRLQHLQGRRLPAGAQPRRRIRAQGRARQLHRARAWSRPISPRRCGKIPTR